MENSGFSNNNLGTKGLGGDAHPAVSHSLDHIYIWYMPQELI